MSNGVCFHFVTLEALLDSKKLKSDENADKYGGKKVYKDVDEVIVLAGGVSTFQYIAFTMIVLGMVCGAFILYSIAYFTKVPQLLCKATPTSAFESCENKDACNPDKTFAFIPDPDAIDTMTNWVS